MNERQRPNLGGLFNGSTPPDRSSRISGAFDPRFLKQLPADQRTDDVVPEPAGRADDAATRASAADTEVPVAQPEGGQGGRATVLSLDPTKIVEQYFAFLQVLLDTNRKFAVAVTSTVMSLPMRVRSR